MANITLVLLPQNDDDHEMERMRAAIQSTLLSHQHRVSLVDLPEAKGVQNQDEVWLCGHSRFLEPNMSLRKFSARNLGGYPLPDIAVFLNDCIQFKNVATIRLICCETAQHNDKTRQPQAGAPQPAPLDKDLGTIRSMALTTQTFNGWQHLAAPNISHLEQLLVCMKMAWDSSKSKATPFPAFKVVGLWGTGDVVQGKPITSFLQQGGGLDAEEAAGKDPEDKKKQMAFAAFHCAAKNLPDFFGYDVPANFFRDPGIAAIQGKPFQD